VAETKKTGTIDDTARFLPQNAYKCRKCEHWIGNLKALAEKYFESLKQMKTELENLRCESRKNIFDANQELT
jgi:hypothetical protein